MSVRVQFTAIRANTKRIPASEVYVALREYTVDYCYEIIMQMVYPPPPEMPSYKRTFRLLRNWRLNDLSSGSGIQYRIQNSTQDKWGRYYSGYVHGPSQQTSFHAAHGHKNIRDLVDRPRFRSETQAVITGVVR